MIHLEYSVQDPNGLHGSTSTHHFNRLSDMYRHLAEIADQSEEYLGVNVKQAKVAIREIVTLEKREAPASEVN